MKRILAGSALALAASGIVAGSAVFNHPNQFFPFTTNHPALAQVIQPDGLHGTVNAIATNNGDYFGDGPATTSPIPQQAISNPTAVEYAANRMFPGIANLDEHLEA
jgi:hypothetical protein